MTQGCRRGTLETPFVDGDRYTRGKIRTPPRWRCERLPRQTSMNTGSHAHHPRQTSINTGSNACGGVSVRTTQRGGVSALAQGRERAREREACPRGEFAKPARRRRVQARSRFHGAKLDGRYAAHGDVFMTANLLPSWRDIQLPPNLISPISVVSPGLTTTALSWNANRLPAIASLVSAKSA